MSFFRNKTHPPASIEAGLRQSPPWRPPTFYNRQDGETLLAISAEGLRLGFFLLETIFQPSGFRKGEDHKADRGLDGQTHQNRLGKYVTTNQK